jgi:hypothetical protein
MPAEALRIFAQCVHESGVPEDDITTLIRTNPAELLGIDGDPPLAAAEASADGAAAT